MLDCLILRMGGKMYFPELTEEQLFAECKAARVVERDSTIGMLRYLLDVEKRLVFAKRGFSSMFAFGMEVLGYTDDEMTPRLRAMSLMELLPEIDERIESGELSLSVVSNAEGFFR